MATAPPEIPTIATHQEHARLQQHWRTVFLGVGVLSAYALLFPWLPHSLRLPVAWCVLMPPLGPSVVVLALGWWWQPWERRAATDPFEHMPPPEDPPS